MNTRIRSRYFILPLPADCRERKSHCCASSDRATDEFEHGQRSQRSTVNARHNGEDPIRVSRSVGAPAALSIRHLRSRARVAVGAYAIKRAHTSAEIREGYENPQAVSESRVWRAPRLLQRETHRSLSARRCLPSRRIPSRPDSSAPTCCPSYCACGKCRARDRENGRAATCAAQHCSP